MTGISKQGGWAMDGKVFLAFTLFHPHAFQMECLPKVCRIGGVEHPATDIHHRFHKSQVPPKNKNKLLLSLLSGGYLWHPGNLMWICREHHQQATIDTDLNNELKAEACLPPWPIEGTYQPTMDMCLMCQRPKGKWDFDGLCKTCFGVRARS